jgi:hypothetical protein
MTDRSRHLTFALLTAISLTRPVGAQPAAQTALLRAADGYMDADLDAFHAARARRPPPFDWGSNGCNFGEVTGPYQRLFDRACDRHDFGYRNYGGRGLRLDPSERRRLRIDARLHEDLRSLCARHHPTLAARAACNSAAASVYATVLGAGSPWFHDAVPLPSNLPAVSPAAILPRIRQGLPRVPRIPSVPLRIPGLR